MQDNIFIKNYEERINTVDSLMEHTYEEAFKNLQFKYKTLEHQYAVLQNQFQLYSSQTYGKINSLEGDMDQLVQEKDKAYKALCLENKTLKEENTKLRSQILTLQSQVDKQIKKAKTNQHELKNTVFTYQKNESKQKEIVMNFQRELSLKIGQVQSLKDILNNERMATLAKDQIVITKDNHIAELLSQIKSISIELQSQREIEDQIKDSNYKLRKEVQQLRLMFDEMQSGLRNCQKCRILELKNLQLKNLLRQKQNFRPNHSYSIDRPNKRTATIETQKSRFEYRNPRMTIERDYLADITLNDIRPTRDFYQGRSVMKNSVVRRCKIALDKD